MASMSAIPSPGPLPNRPHVMIRLPPTPAPEGSGAPVPEVVKASDQAQIRSGKAALEQLATASLWSMDFDLPVALLPVAPAKRDYAETPDVTLDDAGAVGHGVQQAAGSVGQGIQQAAGFVGDAALNAWTAVISFRLW